MRTKQNQKGTIDNQTYSKNLLKYNNKKYKNRLWWTPRIHVGRCQRYWALPSVLAFSSLGCTLP